MDPASTYLSRSRTALALYANLIPIASLFSSNLFLLSHYGLTGIWLVVFGSKDVLRAELQVLASDGEQVAADFKKATQDESNMIAVAGTIVAQIAITALSLMNLSATHWTARGLFSFSLVSSIIAVYYASNQHRVMGRCLNAIQVKDWVRGGAGSDSIEEKKPAASSILTLSAPVMLLSASLNSFLAGFCVYLGMIWTKNLDQDTDPGDSFRVFLVYFIGLGVCYGIYAMSTWISGVGLMNASEFTELLRQANSTRNGEREIPLWQRSIRHVEVDRDLRIASPATNFEHLAQALSEAAALRERSAEADRHVAEIYRDLGRQSRRPGFVN